MVYLCENDFKKQISSTDWGSMDCEHTFKSVTVSNGCLCTREMPETREWG